MLGFSRVLGTTNVTGGGGAFLRNVFCGVSATGAMLVDNFGVPPLASPPPVECDP